MIGLKADGPGCKLEIKPAAHSRCSGHLLIRRRRSMQFLVQGSTFPTLSPPARCQAPSLREQEAKSPPQVMTNGPAVGFSGL